MTATTTSAWPLSGLEGSQLAPLWLDTADRPEPRSVLSGRTSADLLVVGGGFTGLWTALRAAERHPDWNIVLIEADRLAEHATGRNGGFCEASITHGEENGRNRWPDEYETLHRMGMENLDGIQETVQRYGIDCGLVRGGLLNVATREHEVAAMDPGREGFLDAEAVREYADSPTYLSGRFEPGVCAVVDPARLAWGIAEAAESLGVRIAEHTRLTKMTPRKGADGVVVITDQGQVEATHVALATNAFPNPLRRLRYHTVPVWDYVLATEPLTDEQLDSIGWDPGIGISDSGNQFHYYRVTPDQRILWGGYDVIYHYGRSTSSEHYDRPETFTTLAEHFGETFPQLEGIRFTHRWSGVIDTSTQFCAFYGTAHRGAVSYALGFTGLGVGASRFAAEVMLDLLTGEETQRTQLQMVRRKPLPFPPEPLAWTGIQLTTIARHREDATGKRSRWLKTLDSLGLGFDS